MKGLLIIILLGCLSCIPMTAGQDTLFVSTSQVLHLRFASELKYVNLGNGVLIAKVVDGSKDFVAVKAREAFDFYTSMSCLESNGRMHTFVVAYKDGLEIFDVDTRGNDLALSEDKVTVRLDTLHSAFLSFEEIARMRKELYHIGVKDYDISVMCDDIFVKDDVLYIVLSLKNDSVMSYSLANPRFAVESRKKTKRGLQYEKAVFARWSYNLGTVAPGDMSRMVFAFDKVTLVKGQVFRIYLYEKGGARNFMIIIGEMDVNRARRG